MNPAPNLVLVGPMGAGKSSIGKRLAARLDLEFVDADQHLALLAGASVRDIFELEGEAAFRRRETQLIGALLEATAQVIATGGGIVLSAANRELLQARAFVVYLKVGVARQLERLARDQSRPLLAGGDRQQKLEDLAAVRNPLYEQIADLTFEPESLSVEATSAALFSLVNARWQREDAA